MPTVVCPSCRSLAAVDPADLGYEVTCPVCGEQFVARASRRAGDEDAPVRGGRPADDEDAPRRRSRRFDEDDEDEDDRPRRRRRRRADPDEVIDDARRAVFLPALLSLVACGLGVLFHIADGLLVLLNPQFLQNNPFGGGANIPVGAYLALRVVAVVWELVIAAGAVGMMRLRGRSFAMVAMVMHIIPCAGVCCILGLPLGVWGLVVLNRPDVTEGFELVARGE